MSGPFVGLWFVSLHVRDLPSARRFYEDVLGLPVEKVVGDDEVLYGFFGTTLSVHADPEGACGRLPGGPTGFYLRTRDLAASLAALRGRGVEITFEDARSFGFADPDGNEFVVFPVR